MIMEYYDAKYFLIILIFQRIISKWIESYYREVQQFVSVLNNVDFQ